MSAAANFNRQGDSTPLSGVTARDACPAATPVGAQVGVQGLRRDGL